MPKVTLPGVGKIESLGILFTLLPGLLTYVVVHALTKKERKLDAIEVVLHGLVYTLLVHAFWSALTIWPLIPTPDIVGLSLSAIIVGLVVAKINNNGWIYSVLRHFKITHAASWNSIWETSFRYAMNDVGEYAVLHLKDGRRLMGAVRRNSVEQADGHVSLEQAQWLDKGKAATPADGLIIVPGEEISHVHFLPK